VGIDWFTFAAQIVNFLILVGLLWKFAYRPLLAAMDRREATIRERLDEAEARGQEAERRQVELAEEREKLAAERNKQLSKAREEADERRQELLAAARERVAASEQAWRADLRRQQSQLATDLQRHAGRQALAAARQIVGDLADADLQQRIVARFGQRLEKLDEGEREGLREALAAADGEATVVTAVALGDEEKGQLREQLGALGEREVELAFEEDGQLVAGVELRVGDRRVAWSAADYLDELEEAVAERIAAATRPRDEHGEGESAEGEGESGGDGASGAAQETVGEQRGG
jgi:F-type H+-transporting ATPase subunit b